MFGFPHSMAAIQPFTYTETQFSKNKGMSNICTL